MKKYFVHRFRRLLGYRTPDWRRQKWIGAFNQTKIRLKTFAGRMRGRAGQFTNSRFKSPKR